MLSIENISELVKSVSGISPADLAKDEEFWASIRKGYKLNPIISTSRMVTTASCLSRQSRILLSIYARSTTRDLTICGRSV